MQPDRPADQPQPFDSDPQSLDIARDVWPISRGVDPIHRRVTTEAPHNVTDLHALTGVPRGKPVSRPAFLTIADDESEWHANLAAENRRTRRNRWLLFWGLCFCLGVGVAWLVTP